MDKATRAAAARASSRCEYCRLDEADDAFRLHVELFVRDGQPDAVVFQTDGTA
jgi:hypothetical protein